MVEHASFRRHSPLAPESESKSKSAKSFASPEDVRLWLEWAGSRLLAMSIPSPFPKEPSAAWPEYASDARQAYGYTPNRLRPAQPSRHEIDLMDEILLLPSLIRDVNSRRIVNARALVTPVANRYVYSWTKIAFMLHTDRKRVVRLHYLGLREIGAKLPEEKRDAISASISLWLT